MCHCENQKQEGGDEEGAKMCIYVSTSTFKYISIKITYVNTNIYVYLKRKKQKSLAHVLKDMLFWGE